MKVLLINGSPHEKGTTARALQETAGRLEAAGIETVHFWIGTKPVRGCIDCCKCWGNDHCVFDDDCANAAKDLFAAADGVIVGSPVYFAGINGSLKCLLDRIFYDSKRLYSHKLGAAVLVCRRGGIETAFNQINDYFALASMPVISSQYWNGAHGDAPEELEQDAEGLQCLRRLGDNMAYWLKCREAAEAAGLKPPVPEKRIRTNFYKAPGVQ